jgi:prevent-host-death family protein
MKTIGSFEAKTHLSRLLDQVERGEVFTITKNGRPVAKLVPIAEPPRRDVPQAIADLLALRKERAGRGLSVAEIKETIDEGRRL